MAPDQRDSALTCRQGPRGTSQAPVTQVDLTLGKEFHKENLSAKFKVWSSKTNKWTLVLILFVVLLVFVQ